jgi:hypothetical protein
LTDDNPSETLRGKTLEVYRFILKTGTPVGVRQVQRKLKLSSPSVALYHLTKLEDACLLRKERGDYVINRVFLENSVRIGHLLIPRYLFYSIFALTILILELAVFRPSILTREYFFTTTATLVFTLAFFYETAKVWRRGRP